MHMLFAACLPGAEVFEPRRQILSSERSHFQGRGSVDAWCKGLPGARPGLAVGRAVPASARSCRPGGAGGFAICSLVF